MKKLITRSYEEIMTTVYKPIEFVIDGLLAQGLYILAGAPKVGKSWLALDMCCCYHIQALLKAQARLQSLHILWIPRGKGTFLY